MKYFAKSQIYIKVFKLIDDLQIYHKHILFILENVVNHVQSDEISNEKIMKRKCNDYNNIRNKFRLPYTTHTSFIVL